MRHRTLFFCSCGAILAGAIPFFVKITAWPEMIVPAYFLSRGAVPYESIFFPYTPLLIYALAASGGLLGFSAGLFRSIIAAAMASTAVLVVLGTPKRRVFAPAAVLGVLLSILWLAYLDGLAVWPDPLLAPVALAAGLLLERFEASGSERALWAAGLVLGNGILVKQTSAWIALAALLWLLIRRRPLRRIGVFALFVAAPYAVFAVAWAALHRTTAHLTWTLIFPLLKKHGGEIPMAATLDDLHESLAPFLALPALFLLDRSLGERRASPLPFLAVGAVGMAWPRAELLHLSACSGLVAVIAARAFLAAWEFFRRGREERVPALRLAAGAGGAALLLTSLAVASLSGGSNLADSWRGGAYYWDDPLTEGLLAGVRGRLTADRRIYLFNVPRDTLYVRAGALTPDGTYVNSAFWYYLKREGLDGRVTSGLRHFRGWFLCRDLDPNQGELMESQLYRFLSRATVERGRVGNDLSWRVLGE